ncbi:Protoporphyrinogen oxidase [Helicobacter cinaedi]|uniref:Protoporphyrinogen oxidase n=1 Tax=Helicobacter cinaedi TaxID=213 RepID=A0A377JWN7_9HELI|nr:FAD-dependent oxidoreductase [Helicobacter cinaedi]STP14242.1 Protoporphyrinogen oxidase [Helicobacter cinaedi]
MHRAKIPKRRTIQSFLKNLVRQTTIEYNKEVKCIDTKKKVLSFSDGKQTSYDALISTLPLPEIIKTMPDAHKDVKDAAKNLHHTQVALISLGFNKPDIPKNLWFYVYDEDILFARV